jgi:acyl transferase domain-containing protein
MGHLAPAALDASTGREPIATGGLGCRVPGEVECLDPSWRLLRAGADAYGPISPWPFDANDFYGGLLAAPGHIEPRLGNFLDGIEEFDGGFSNISPRDSGRLAAAADLSEGELAGLSAVKLARHWVRDARCA